MRKFLLSLIAIFFSFRVEADPCAPSKHMVVPNITGDTYHQARAKLLKSQWQPLMTVPPNQAEDLLRYSGNGWIFWEKGYDEVEACAGTGMAPCVFNFSDIYGNILRVHTSGEELPEYDTHAVVASYGFYCGELGGY